ncbi:MAG: hypothetical protein ACTHJJ_00795 [Intrasporangium sp.]|uniref:hypothetical protein n=1 Tax=Intrasporangium sp. TaxID=1925024 RepID=UPI003F800581
MAVRFNVPPGWPTPPLSWTPGEDWLPDPSWPEPPAGWSFWTPVLDGGGSLTVADRAALQAELVGAGHGSYGCTVVTWWAAAGEMAPPPDGARQAPLEARPAMPVVPVMPVDAPRRRIATLRRRGLLIAAVIVCALGLVGFQASRMLFVSDGEDGQEIPKPLPVSDTRVPTTHSSHTSAVTAPSVPAAPATDRPELVAARLASPSSTTSGAITTRTGTATLAPTTTAAATVAPGRTTAPAATTRATATSPAAPTSSRSTRTAAPKPTVPARPSTVAPSKPLVPTTASAVPAGGGRS